MAAPGGGGGGGARIGGGAGMGGAARIGGAARMGGAGIGRGAHIGGAGLGGARSVGARPVGARNIGVGARNVGASVLALLQPEEIGTARVNAAQFRQTGVNRLDGQYAGTELLHPKPKDLLLINAGANQFRTGAAAGLGINSGAATHAQSVGQQGAAARGVQTPANIGKSASNLQPNIQKTTLGQGGIARGVRMDAGVAGAAGAAGVSGARAIGAAGRTGRT